MTVRLHIAAPTAADRNFGVSALWGAAILTVAIGELLPGGSPLMAWIGSSGIGDRIEHFTAYFVLAAIPVLGFEARKGIFAAFSMIVFGAPLSSQTLPQMPSVS